MRTLIMMFVFLVAQTSFCLADFVDREESRKIVTKGKLVGEWVADGAPAGAHNRQVLYKAFILKDVFYICHMSISMPMAILDCFDHKARKIN